MGRGSRREGRPRVLLGAMSRARPVVATAVGGIPEITRREETGVLVPARDSAAIAEAVLQLLRDPAVAEQLGARGREVMMRDFHIDVLAEKLAGVYRKLLDGKSTAATS